MTERYPTPDGSLTLLVVREDGDITIGFEGLPWHTHADIIASLRGEEDKEQALREYLDDLFHDRLPIILMTKGGTISEPYVPEFPDEPIDTKYFEPDESYEVRFWSGSKKSAQPGGTDNSGAAPRRV